MNATPIENRNTLKINIPFTELAIEVDLPPSLGVRSVMKEVFPSVAGLVATSAGGMILRDHVLRDDEYLLTQFYSSAFFVGLGERLIRNPTEMNGGLPRLVAVAISIAVILYSFDEMSILHFGALYLASMVQLLGRRAMSGLLGAWQI